MVNVNIPIPDELHKKVKLAALLDDKTLKDYILAQLERAIRAEGAPSRQAGKPLKKDGGGA